MAENGIGTVIDPGAGAGGAGGEGGGVVTEDPIVPDPGTGGEGGEGGGEPAPGGESGEGGEPGAKGGEGGAEDPIPEENPYDGRKIDDATRKQIAAMRKVDPNLARTAQDALFKVKAVMGEFPDAKGIGDVLNGIREVKQTLEAVGGQEGLTNLQETAKKYETEIDQFSNGDPALLQDLHESNPDAFATSIENGLSLLQEKNGEFGGLFDKTFAVPFAARVRATGLHTAMANIRTAIEKQDEGELTKWVGRVGEWLGQVDKYAEEVGKGKDPKTMDPRERQLNEREQKLKTQETERQKQDGVAYENKVGASVNTLNNETLKPMLDRAVKDLKLQPAGAKRLTDQVQHEIYAAMKADKIFQRDARNIKNKGDVDKTANFVSAKFKSLAPDIFRKVYNELYPNAGAPRPATGANGGGKAAPAPGGAKPAGAPQNKVSYKGGRPQFDMVDWKKTPDEDWIRGAAVLTDGTKVKFDPNAPRNTFN